MYRGPAQLSSPEPQRRRRERMLGPGCGMRRVPLGEPTDGGGIAGKASNAIWTIDHNAARGRPLPIQRHRVGTVEPRTGDAERLRMLRSRVDAPGHPTKLCRGSDTQFVCLPRELEWSAS